jgi:hypothetical protein
MYTSRMCKDCMTDENKAKCNICNLKTNELEFEDEIALTSMKELIESYLSELFDDLEKRTTDAISRFKSKESFFTNFH